MHEWILLSVCDITLDYGTMAPTRYNGFELLSLRPAVNVARIHLQLQAIHKLRDLGLCSRPPTRRGTRAGKHKHRAVPVTSSKEHASIYFINARSVKN